MTMNWAEYEEEEKQAERSFWLELLGAVVTGISLAMLIWSLQGCAAVEKPFCFMKLVGQTMDGTTVVVQHCMTEEEFTESQK